MRCKQITYCSLFLLLALLFVYPRDKANGTPHLAVRQATVHHAASSHKTKPDMELAGLIRCLQNAGTLENSDAPPKSNSHRVKHSGYSFLFSSGLIGRIADGRHTVSFPAFPATDFISFGQKLLFPKHWFW